MSKDVIILTGAGQIGMAIARRMGYGMKIVVGDRNLDNAKAICGVMNNAGFDAVPFEMDLSSRESILSIIAEAQKYGEIAMLVNAAGVSPSQASIETILRVDLYGTAALLEEVGKVIRHGGTGVTISSQSGHRMPALTPPFGMTSVYKAVKSDEYMVAVDTHGKLRWPASEIDGVPLICIVSEQVPQEYLEMLRNEGISYICTGKDAIDLPAAMEILCSEFGVERMAVLGGGHINGGFLAAGLIDEVSMLLAPGIDGRKGQTALFDGIVDMNRTPVCLSLESVERIDNDKLWIRYKTTDK